uniref:Uncharacterized protein n=1 Tax=Nelumbo nucifera TaxID=4432 RepID=A0A822Y6B5_NELNU|nr:TPA_asm: hypothetical protein HUJ06_031002 [Nelumbo nucifera]
MAGNKVVAVFLVLTLVMSIHVEEIRCGSFWEELVKAFNSEIEKPPEPKTNLQHCLEFECMPKCLKLPGSTTQVCKKECTAACQRYSSTRNRS